MTSSAHERARSLVGEAEALRGAVRILRREEIRLLAERNANRARWLFVTTQKVGQGRRERVYRKGQERRREEEASWEDAIGRLLDRHLDTLDVGSGYRAATWTLPARARKTSWWVLRKEKKAPELPPDTDEVRLRILLNQWRKASPSERKFLEQQILSLTGLSVAEARAALGEFLAGALPPSLAAVSEGLGFTTEALINGGMMVYLSMAAKTSALAGQTALEHMGLNRTFAWAHPQNMARDLFAVRGSKVIQNMYGEHRQALSRLIVEATDPRNPLTVQQVQTRIKEQWPKLKTWQAKRIARTETAAVWTTTSANAYEANGVTMFESLVAHGPSIGVTQDAPCDLCIEMAIELHSIATDLPPWHANCACEAVPILEDPETGETWLPPDEPWTGDEGIPLVPAPSPGEGFGGTHYSVLDASLVDEEAEYAMGMLRSEIELKWKLGNSTQVAKKVLDDLDDLAKVEEEKGAAAEVWVARDQAGSPLSLAGVLRYDDLDTIRVTGLASRAGGAKHTLRRVAQDAVDRNFDLRVEGKLLSSQLKSTLQDWTYIETDDVYFLSREVIAGKLGLSKTIVEEVAAEEITVTGTLAELKAQLYSANNKISGLKTKIKQYKMKGTDQVKVDEALAKLKAQETVRDQLKAKIKSMPKEKAPKKPVSEEDGHLLPVNEIDQMRDSLSALPQGIALTARPGPILVGKDVYLSDARWTYWRRGDVVVRMEEGSGAGARARVDQLLDRMSVESLKGSEKLKVVTVARGKSPSTDYWRKKYKDPEFEVAAQGGDGQVWIWSGERNVTQGGFDHELGHVLGVERAAPSVGEWARAITEDLTWSKQRFPHGVVSTGYRDIQVGRRGVTPYAENAEIEDWAESVRLYLLDLREGRIGTLGERFADVFPARAKLIQRWLGKEELVATEARAAVPGNPLKDKDTAKLLKEMTEGARGGAGRLKGSVMTRIAARVKKSGRWDPDAVRQAFNFRLGEYSGDVDEQVTAQLIKNWAITSSDADARGVAIQIAAKEELGLDVDAFAAQYWNNPEMNRRVLSEAELLLQRPGIRPSLRAFIRAQYEETQAMLAELGVEEITVYRGLRIKDETPWGVGVSALDIADNPLASWSIKHSVARRSYFYGGTILRASVPREMVFSSPLTGFGCASEYEVLVLNGGRNKAWVAQSGVKKLSIEEMHNLKIEEREIIATQERLTTKAKKLYHKVRPEMGGRWYGSPEEREWEVARNSLYQLSNQLAQVRGKLQSGTARWSYSKETELKQEIARILEQHPELSGKPLVSKKPERAARKPGEGLTPEKRARNRVSSLRARLNATRDELDEMAGGPPVGLSEEEWIRRTNKLLNRVNEIQAKLTQAETDLQSLLAKARLCHIRKRLRLVR